VLKNMARPRTEVPSRSSPLLSLRDTVASAAAPQFFYDRGVTLRFNDLNRGTSLRGRLADVAGRPVLLATASQLTAALALIELDGHARSIAILPPDVAPEHLGALMTGAEIAAIVIDADTPRHAVFDALPTLTCAPSIEPTDEIPPARLRTEWRLLTSGTTGVPKMVRHGLASLSAAIAAASPADGATVWGTFYDIRRYGGLQIFLRTVLGGASLVLSNGGEPVAEHLDRLGRRGVTHLSGTPSHWRRALMNPAIDKIAPRYVRLSGEIADQAVLDALRAKFPHANIGHAYASTEAGVAFDVNDGLAGFPASYVGPERNGVEMKVSDGSLRIRSSRTASGYVGTQQALADEDGFVDTGDMVERRNDRFYFIGRKGGIINIGGLKVHPEEVEAVINRHPRVRMSLVRSKKSPITGALVVADVVLKSQADAAGEGQGTVKDDILKLCREALPRHKVPAAISFVPSLQVAATGKLTRRYG
jgi:acyl-CoA synthetase (AMP-forming)/AMP-acid ligase II